MLQDESSLAAHVRRRMIMSRTPLRITFVGGGTDIPSFYRDHGPGAVISASINKYIYVIVNKKFDSKIRVSYSVTEIVDHVDQIRHPTVREALKFLGITGGIEIVSISDIPSRGTGLGSSSTFIVGLLNALHAYLGEHASPKQLAEEAVKIEREILQEPGGKQDQYMAAYGGIQMMEFFPDERVEVRPVIMSERSRDRLQNSLLLFYTGRERSSTEIHKNQAQAVVDKVNSYRIMKDLAYRTFDALSSDRVEDVGRMMHENWLQKKSLAAGISDSWIDALYDKAISAGAIGGKMIGAGGGGFLLVFAEPSAHERIASSLSELRREDFRIEYQGSRIVFVGD